MRHDRTTNVDSIGPVQGRVAAPGGSFFARTLATTAQKDRTAFFVEDPPQIGAGGGLSPRAVVDRDLKAELATVGTQYGALDLGRPDRPQSGDTWARTF